MAYLEIPVRTDIYSYTEKVTLDGVLYTLGFHFNSRKDCWVMDIGDSAGEILLAGIPLMINYPLTRRFIGYIDGLPNGQFMMIDETDQERNAGRDNLGDDIKLIYLEAN